MSELASKKRKVAHTSDTSSLDGIEPEMDSEVLSQSEPENHVLLQKNGVRAQSPRRKSGPEHRIKEAKSQTRTSSYKKHNGSGDTTSMLALQVNDLLMEKRPNYEALSEQVEEHFQKIRGIILDLRDVKSLSVAEAVKALKAKGVRVPFPEPSPDRETNYKLEYRRPEKIELIGKLPFNVATLPDESHSVDIAVHLPADLFQEKDFLNSRYFHKRAYYLAQIAVGITADGGYRMHFQYQDGVVLKPVLVVGPIDTSTSGDPSSRIQFRLICNFSPGSFPHQKTLPGKCCLRSDGNTDSTPFYNAALRADASVNDHREIMAKTASSCEAFQDVCRLGQIWLSSRGLGSETTKGGFGASEWSLLCAILLQTGGAQGRPLLSSRHSCLLLFKSMLQFLAAQDLIVSPFLNGLRAKDNSEGFPVFFDSSSQMNILYKMTPWSYHLLREETQTSLDVFNSKSMDSFNMVFPQYPEDLQLKYDETYLVQCDFGFESYQTHLKNGAGALLYASLKRALGNRARRIHLAQDPLPTWTINKHFKHDPALNRIRINLVLDPEHAGRLVDRGPSAEEEVSAAEFRQFWGDKAELRRFKDGSITETLGWREDTPVSHQILSHIIPRTFHPKSCTIHFLGHRVETVLDDPDMRSRAAAFKFINSAFQSLSSTIRQLKGLPLSIHSILAASPQLRYSSLWTPLTSNPPEPIDIQIIFEGSSRWPDSLAAIQRTKLAFLLKLSDLLTAASAKILTRIGLENTEDPTTPYLNPGYLDILFPYPPFPAPLPFRLRIHHTPTGTLLRSLLPTLPGPQKPILQAALHSQARSTAISQHTSAISRLCTRFPSLPTALYLLHSWIASHNLSNQIPGEVLDLIVTHPYLHPHPYPFPPATGQTAFLRILDLLARWDWIHDPLVIDLSVSSTPSLDPDDPPPPTTHHLRTQAHARLLSWRQHLDPSLSTVVWLLATSLDETAVVWTQGSRPSRLVAGRVGDLARASLRVVRDRSAAEAGAGSGEREQERERESEIGLGVRREWKELFAARLADFDFLIRLRDPAGLVARAAKDGDNGDWEGLGFDPVGMFLADLERLFSPAVIVFFHGYGQRAVGGLWNPKALGGGEWRVKMGWSSIPVVEGDAVHGRINQRGILAEIEALGQGIVKRIEVVKPLLEG